MFRSQKYKNNTLLALFAQLYDDTEWNNIWNQWKETNNVFKDYNFLYNFNIKYLKKASLHH